MDNALNKCMYMYLSKTLWRHVVWIAMHPEKMHVEVNLLICPVATVIAMKHGLLSTFVSYMSGQSLLPCIPSATLYTNEILPRNLGAYRNITSERKFKRNTQSC